MPSLIDYTNRFWAIRLARDDLGDRETTVYFWLLQLANRQGWPAKVEASTAALCRVLHCPRASLVRARNRLEAAGLVEIHPGNRKKQPRYTLVYTPKNPEVLLKETQTCSTKGSCPDTQPDTRDKTDRQTERERGSMLSLDQIVSVVEAQFPSRADVRELAQRMDAHGGPITANRLKQWVRGEKYPKFKEPEPEPEPEGWREKFLADYPQATEPGAWTVFKQKHPEIAAKYAHTDT